MGDYNLPPGVTAAMIDKALGYEDERADGCSDCGGEIEDNEWENWLGYKEPDPDTGAYLAPPPLRCRRCRLISEGCCPECEELLGEDLKCKDPDCEGLG
jgi:hypothetical protein